MNLFHRSDPKAEMRKNERVTRSAQRELTRDQQNLDREEKRLESEIKKSAAKGDRETCTVLAKQLINVRKQRQRTVGFNAKLTTIKSQQRIAASTATMGKVMDSTANTMKKMNKQMDATGLSKTLKEFSKVSSQMDMKEEMMDDLMNDIGATSEGEEDAVIQKVLDGIGVEMSGEIAKAPVPSSSVAASDEDDLVRLQKQLDDLRS
ncbi:unnamed protein product [Calicophoron daubneyi]|uniref:Charged multivesicular body protein 2b n=1 Tax=Calicophoron daubneyi TaxID=300641 RepID=A0AAV2TRQ0_CALDB